MKSEKLKNENIDKVILMELHAIILRAIYNKKRREKFHQKKNKDYKELTEIQICLYNKKKRQNQIYTTNNS